MNYVEIQKEVIEKYEIRIEENSTCRSRMHAHVKERKVCKWTPKNSYRATFDLLHEIGHIVTTKSIMRRAESEYFATIFAIDVMKSYRKPIDEDVLFKYQRYILLEIRRGLRRGGKDYDDLNLYHYLGRDVSLEQVYERCDDKWKRFIDGKI